MSFNLLWTCGLNTHVTLLRLPGPRGGGKSADSVSFHSISCDKHLTFIHKRPRGGFLWPDGEGRVTVHASYWSHFNYDKLPRTWMLERHKSSTNMFLHHLQGCCDPGGSEAPAAGGMWRLMGFKWKCARVATGRRLVVSASCRKRLSDCPHTSAGGARGG